MENLFLTIQKHAKNIEDERKRLLKELSEIIRAELISSDDVNIMFICTHNSRRSQLAEFLLDNLAKYRNVKRLACFSGGTEATAFNHRMIKAIESFGFNFYKFGDNKNPLYIHEKKGIEHYYFSKIYDHDFNPSENFIAVTVCSDAEENCPVVAGAKLKFHLNYEDPKKFDDTELEAAAYRDKVLEIGSEMLYLLDCILGTTSSP
jgi:arsenate reductase